MPGRSGFHNDYKKSKAVYNNIRSGTIDGVHRDIMNKKAQQQEQIREALWNKTREHAECCINEEIELLLDQEFDYEQIINKLKSDEVFETVCENIKNSITKNNQDGTDNEEIVNSEQNITKGMIIAAYKKYIQKLDATKIAIIKNTKSQNIKGQTYHEANR